MVLFILQIDHLRLVPRISLAAFPERGGFRLVQVEPELVFLGLVVVLGVQSERLASS